MTPPLAFRWSVIAMMPLAPRATDQAFEVGRRYWLENVSPRSPATHNHFFALVSEAFDNLPEHLATRFADPDSLRKYALCMTGWRDERSIVCASKAEARRVAAFVAPMDAYAIVSVNEAMVVVWTARSQSMRAMGKRDFQRSKDDVLSYLATLIGTTPDALAANTRERAA
jgi:hypothetical protein